MANESSALLNLIVTICLFLIILFLLPGFVGGQIAGIAFCNGKGYVNATDGLCVCITGFHGAGCEYRHCPFGTSWLARPVESDVRNMPNVPCSDMGYCNILTGRCECRDGFEGRACERTACPTSFDFTLQPEVEVDPGLVSLFLTSAEQVGQDFSFAIHCSGHGQCKTMREMGNDFDGVTLIRPSINYNNWEADKLQGCICDEGWGGRDCSQRLCPMGRDPTLPSTATAREETFVLQCQADSGYFSVLVLGHFSEPIPFDADPGYLQHALTAMSRSAEVDIVMPADAFTGEPSVCGSTEVVSTEITFTSFIGDRPPIMVTLNTSNTRLWPDGSTPLTLEGGTPVLRMATQHYLTCPICQNCTGDVYFSLGQSISEPISVNTSGAANSIVSAISELGDLYNVPWTNLVVDVNISDGRDTLCSEFGSTETRISLYSDYGNLPFLGILDSTLFTFSTDSSDRGTANLTFTTNAATGEVSECSNQGFCDRTVGVCRCFVLQVNREIEYRTLSSDGTGGPGFRGDCGFIETPVKSCFIDGKEACGGNGYCANSTNTCVCNDGYHGITCDIKDCPKGPAWFDEPIAVNRAHQLIDCSGTGSCDRTTGFCRCEGGYTGSACQYRDCPRVASTGDVCSGRGVCVTVAQFYEMFGFTYGDPSVGIIDGGSSTWDAFTWWHCLCSAKRSAGYLGDPFRPSVGPSGLISGYSAGSPPLLGWGGWDCTWRNCPKGAAARGVTPKREIQQVLCSLHPSLDEAQYFVLEIFGEPSSKIYTNFTAAEIKAALEYPAVVGNLTVWFPQLLSDNISTACDWRVNSTHGGFFVRFDTEFGDLDLYTDRMGVANLTIIEYQKGTGNNEPCGGTTVGFCNRDTGTCVCNSPYGSSNGEGEVGSAGDCGYYVENTIGTDDDPFTVFNIRGKDV